MCNKIRVRTVQSDRNVALCWSSHLRVLVVLTGVDRIYVSLVWLFSSGLVCFHGRVYDLGVETVKGKTKNFCCLIRVFREREIRSRNLQYI
jgi:hypothetical protein